MEPDNASTSEALDHSLSPQHEIERGNREEAAQTGGFDPSGEQGDSTEEEPAPSYPPLPAAQIGRLFSQVAALPSLAVSSAFNQLQGAETGVFDRGGEQGDSTEEEPTPSNPSLSAAEMGRLISQVARSRPPSVAVSSALNRLPGAQTGGFDPSGEQGDSTEEEPTPSYPPLPAAEIGRLFSQVAGLPSLAGSSAFNQLQGAETGSFDRTGEQGEATGEEQVSLSSQTNTVAGQLDESGSHKGDQDIKSASRK